MVEWKELGIVGKGSYGTVYVAVLIAPQEVNGELIAVKSSSQPETLASLEKEKNILESFFGCKEIIQCIWSQYTMQSGRLNYNLLLEFAPYGSLKDLIKKLGPLLNTEIRVYTHMLLKGLSCIHKIGVVHCDLKPDNILLFPNSSEDGDAMYQLKIADFGLSKTREENFDAEFWKLKFRGAPLYMSPESVMGQIATPLDIWSLGCVVIEMITGLPVWRNLTIEEIMFKLAFLKEAPEIPNKLGHDCKDFLSKCFVKDPSERWTATMLLNHPFVTCEYDMFSSSISSYDMVMNK